HREASCSRWSGSSPSGPSPPRSTARSGSLGGCRKEERPRPPNPPPGHVDPAPGHVAPGTKNGPPTEGTGGRSSLTFLHSGDRTRTCDPLINSQLLYQLSYAGSGCIPGDAPGPK